MRYPCPTGEHIPDPEDPSVCKDCGHILCHVCGEAPADHTPGQADECRLESAYV